MRSIVPLRELHLEHHRALVFRRHEGRRELHEAEAHETQNHDVASHRDPLVVDRVLDEVAHGVREGVEPAVEPAEEPGLAVVLLMVDRKGGTWRRATA